LPDCLLKRRKYHKNLAFPATYILLTFPADTYLRALNPCFLQSNGQSGTSNAQFLDAVLPWDASARDTLAGKGKAGRIPPLWDGHAAKRIVDILLKEVPRGHAS
jgi:hypothetical protein